MTQKQKQEYEVVTNEQIKNVQKMAVMVSKLNEELMAFAEKYNISPEQAWKEIMKAR